jgi:arylsulfatase K
LDVDRSVDWLYERARSDDGPFWLYLGIRAPHPAFTISQRYLDVIETRGVSIPPLDESLHPALHYQRIAKNWLHGFGDDVVRQVRHIYFAMIAEVDAMVGRVMAALEASGLDESTYVIFSSDHGELAMEHRQFYKMSMYEASVRVPLIVAGPGVRAGVEVETPVSLVDIYPTLMDMAGLAHPEGLDGHSLMPELSGKRSTHPNWAISEFHGTSVNTGMTMLRRDDYKYVAYAGYEAQLFNLAEDPDEVVNLVQARPEVAAEMDAALREIVDYEEVDARAKAYDRRRFRQWRSAQRGAGTYEQTMAQVYSGWDDLAADQVQPWTAEDEAQIEAWLRDE